MTCGSKPSAASGRRPHPQTGRRFTDTCSPSLNLIISRTLEVSFLVVNNGPVQACLTFWPTHACLVAHASELGYIYGVISASGDFEEVPIIGGALAPLSLAMMDYWLSFVDSLDPNDGLGSLRPNWEAYGDDQVRSPRT